MEKYVICGETFEIDGAHKAEADRIRAGFDRDVKELAVMKWPHAPGILDGGGGLMDAVRERRMRLHADFVALAKRCGTR